MYTTGDDCAFWRKQGVAPLQQHRHIVDAGLSDRAVAGALVHYPLPAFVGGGQCRCRVFLVRCTSSSHRSHRYTGASGTVRRIAAGTHRFCHWLYRDPADHRCYHCYTPLYPPRS